MWAHPAIDQRENINKRASEMQPFRAGEAGVNTSLYRKRKQVCRKPIQEQLIVLGIILSQPVLIMMHFRRACEKTHHMPFLFITELFSVCFRGAGLAAGDAGDCALWRVTNIINACWVNGWNVQLAKPMRQPPPVHPSVPVAGSHRVGFWSHNMKPVFWSGSFTSKHIKTCTRRQGEMKSAF